MGEAKQKQANDAKITAEMEKLHPRFVELAAKMQEEGCDPIAIVEAMLTVATAQMLAVRGAERTIHALSFAAGGLSNLIEKPQGKAN